MKGQTVEEQGAELILSETKLVKGREFALTLKLQKGNKDSVSAEEVYQAMIRATCYSERDPQTVVRTCHCCKGSPLITFESTDPNAFGFKQNSDGGTEFTLTRCRPNCSSSRDHIKSQLFIAVMGIGPLGLSARTKPFSIVSKDLSPKPSQRNQLIIKEHFFVKQGQEQADHKQGEYRQCTRQLTTNIGDNPLVAPHLGTNTLGLPWHKMGLPPQEILKEIAHLLCGPYPSSPRCPVLPQIAQEAACHTLAPLSTARSTRVIVRLYATRLSTASIASLMDEFRQILERQCRLVDYRWQTMPGFLVTFTTATSTESLDLSTTLSEHYVHNTIPNTWKTDLTEAKLLVFIATCTNLQ